MQPRIGFISLVLAGIGLAIGSGPIAHGHAQAPPAPPAPQERFTERVDVGRILVDTRVLDEAGRPVMGLTAADFEVTIDGVAVRVESAQWIGRGAPDNDPLPSASLIGMAAPRPRGRLVVFLIQKDLEPVRVKGLMRWSQVNGPLLANLGPDDRVAVLSFDSHLNIWLDFTNDFERVTTILTHDVLFTSPVKAARSPEPSLLARLSHEQGRKSATIEDALRLLGNALEPLSGSKSVVLVGYGFGRLTGTGQNAMMPEYYAARDALQAARATLLCLDVSFADYHSFEDGLNLIAADTGGTVGSLYLGPQEAVERVVRALAGYYVLFADKPPAEKGVHRIAVRLTHANATVLARSSYTEK